MESMVDNLFGNIYKGKKVLITGMLGFKGSWLAYWLYQMGADVTGYSLAPGTGHTHFTLLKLPCEVIEADIRDSERLEKTFASVQPEIVFHMAAQPLVRLSYKEPIETFDTNVMGTLKVFEACRKSGSVKAIVNVTSDKCYENKEWEWGYRETDPMGGYDPYSASKGCAELVTSSYRNSFFHLSQYKKTHNTLLASVRAGNVVGGGDWAEDRIIPDLIRTHMSGQTIEIRNPGAVRPWQHVLDPLSGYLLVGQHLLEGNTRIAEGFNFGPSGDKIVTVGEIVQFFQDIFPINVMAPATQTKVHEAINLKLDCSKATQRLQWQPVWNVKQTLEKTAGWYRAFVDNGSCMTGEDLNGYIADADKQKLVWTQY
jgi:CDP-glucose 4,6-dehydratase